MWLSHVTFANVVETNWAVTCSGNPQFVMAQKLKIIKNNLKVWNKENFGQLKVKIFEADIAVLACQHAHDAVPSKANLLKLNTAKSAFHNWLKAESDVWK